MTAPIDTPSALAGPAAREAERAPRARTALAPLSCPATTRAVLELLADLDWPRARVLDVGAGAGHFSAALGEALEHRHGLAPEQHVFPCDRQPEHFRYERLSCAAVPESGGLPYEDGRFDAVVSIEVIEHVEDQFAFLRELARVTRPGGRVIVSTPNVLCLTSRVRNLVWGFPELFDPLPLADGDRRRLAGHVHPIAPYYLAYGALQAGLERPRLHTDRVKRSAAAWLVPLAPALFAGRLLIGGRLRRKRPEVARENRALLSSLAGFRLLTGRTAILLAEKPLGREARER